MKHKKYKKNSISPKLFEHLDKLIQRIGIIGDDAYKLSSHVDGRLFKLLNGLGNSMEKFEERLSDEVY